MPARNSCPGSVDVATIGTSAQSEFDTVTFPRSGAAVFAMAASYESLTTLVGVSRKLLRRNTTDGRAKLDLRTGWSPAWHPGRR